MSLQQIAERCQQGDRDAYAQLYSACHDQLRSVCLHYVGSETVADDLLHDAFLLIFTRIGELKDTTRVEAWMKSVTRNVSLIYLRQQKQQLRANIRVARSLPEEAPSPLAYDELMAMVDALPDGYRKVFRLSVLEGMNHQQIAELLHIEPHSSSSQLFRAKALLRRWLAPMMMLLLALVLPLALWRTKPLGPALPASTNLPTQAQTDVQQGQQLPPAVADGSAPAEERREQVAKAKKPVKQAQETIEEIIAPADTLSILAPEDTTAHEAPILPLPTTPAGHEETWTADAATASDDHWQLSLAYSGTPNGHAAQLPYADMYTNPIVYDSTSHHSMPFRLRLSLSYRLAPHWQLQTGLEYTRLKSEMQSGNSLAMLRQQQRVQYIGVPIRLSWQSAVAPRLKAYASAGATLHLPLRSTLQSSYLINGTTTIESSTERLHPGTQWSADMGIGLRYEVSPHVSFFVEPTLQHYFSNGSGIVTWNTEHPLVFSLPLGLHFRF